MALGLCGRAFFKAYRDATYLIEVNNTKLSKIVKYKYEINVTTKDK